jgi:hypothetical protein
MLRPDAIMEFDLPLHPALIDLVVEIELSLTSD